MFGFVTVLKFRGGVGRGRGCRGEAGLGGSGGRGQEGPSQSAGQIYKELTPRLRLPGVDLLPGSHTADQYGELLGLFFYTEP